MDLFGLGDVASTKLKVSDEKSAGRRLNRGEDFELAFLTVLSVEGASLPFSIDAESYTAVVVVEVEVGAFIATRPGLEKFSTVVFSSIKSILVLSALSI